MYDEPMTNIIYDFTCSGKKGSLEIWGGLEKGGGMCLEHAKS